MSKKQATASVFDQIREGLEASVAYSKGLLSLETTTLPEPPPKPEPGGIVALRRKLSMSQAVFAATLNVSKKTVQGWEQGIRRPNQASLRLLQVFEEEPRIVRMILAKPSRSETTVNKERRMRSKKSR